MEEKKELRVYYRKLRDGMDRGQAEALSSKLCGHLLASDAYAKAAYLYAYSSLGSEADVYPFVAAAWQQGRHVAFPKVHGEEMRYYEITAFSQLKPGAFGILEPSEDRGAVPVDWREETNRPPEKDRGSDPALLTERTEAGALLVLVPGVAFDRRGHRLGFGKGYYDRHFSAYAGDKTDAAHEAQESAGSDASCILLGVAYSFQIAASLPFEPHDLFVSHLLTEEGLQPIFF